MNDKNTISRSPKLMSADDTALLVVDVQEKLIAVMDGPEKIVFNVGRLVEGATLLGLPVAATEQYPKGLGPTVGELADKLGDVPAKVTFSCTGCPEIFEDLVARGMRKLLVCGIEAHVCVQQTVLDMISAGWQVYVAVDAVGSRNELDYRTSLGRMEAAGAVLTTTEAALFEWCESAENEKFKEISRLVRS